jgi:CheY-like chemotaxis protein
MLGRLGVSCELAKSGSEAVARRKARTVDLIFMDRYMHSTSYAWTGICTRPHMHGQVYALDLICIDRYALDLICMDRYALDLICMDRYMHSTL